MLLNSTRLLTRLSLRNSVLHTPIVRYVKTRKIDLTLKDPADIFEEAKRRMENIPRLEDVDEGREVLTYSSIFEENYNEYLENKKKGVVALTEVLEEEPSAQIMIDFLTRKKPEFGEFNDGVTRRTGVVGVKLGMTRFWDSYWQEVPLTMIYIPNCQVVQVKAPREDGKVPLQVGSIDMNPRRVTKPLLGHFLKAGVHPKKALQEFLVTPDAVLPVGHEITARHFAPGQIVDVTGMTTGKGFQGPMKRWGFRGQPASHGVSVTHRSHGGTGNRIGKVFKGKKMAGQMGLCQRTQTNLTVFMINPVHNIIYVKGSVPATKSGVVIVQDSKRTKQGMDLTMPTYKPDPNEDLSQGTFYDHLIRYPGKRPYVWDAQEYTEETARKIEKKIWEMKYGPNQTPWNMKIVPRNEPLEIAKKK